MLVLTSPVMRDIIDWSLSRIRPRPRSLFLDLTVSAPQLKVLRSIFSTLRKDEHQINSDLDELSCSQLHFSQ